MRLKVTKSKNAASLYVIKSTYEKGRHSSKIVEKLGTEKELREKLDGADPYEWAKRYIEKMNQEEAENSRKVMVGFSPRKTIARDKQVSFHGGHLFLRSIYHKLRLDTICAAITKKYKFTFDLNAILSSLIYGRILFPASKLATREIAQTFVEQPDYEVQHTYRALEALAKESDYIQSELYKNSLAVASRNTKVLFYDCTNFFFEIEQEEGLRQYGHGKDHKPNPIVELGLFMDGDGIPLAFGIHPGNTNEQVTLRPLEKKILTDFELSRFVVCTDAGLASAANRRFNDVQGRAFITTQSIKKLKAQIKDWALEPGGWHLDKDRTGSAASPKNVHTLTQLEERYQDPNVSEAEKEVLESRVYYKERWIKEGDFEQRLIVTFSLRYKNYQGHIRGKQVERARKLIDQSPAKLPKSNANDYKRFIKKEHCTPDGEMAVRQLLSIDSRVLEEEARFDGFYAVCTNLEDPVSDIIKVNRGRWEIEESFRIVKSEFKARPVYLSRDDRIQAHFMTCFLALTIYRLLEKELGKHYTCRNILETLRGMDFYKLSGEGFIPAYKRTELTDALHEAFGFRTDHEIVTTKEMRKILKHTKT